ncbi:MAG: SDR family NAD(P)-dependent oxidoreductase, partial [Chloroflexota bacterium]
GGLGIGRGIARTFAREGARVLIMDIDDEAGSKTVSEIQAAGGDARFLHGDITVQDDLEKMVREAVQTYDRLDVLVNDAMVCPGGPTVDLDPADFDRAMFGIPRANYLACKFAIPAMIESGGGSIVCISSVHGLLPASRNLTYEIGKASLLMLVKQVSVDYGPRGIRANAICPGGVRSRMDDDEPDPTTPRAVYGQAVYPLRRFGRPRDIANAALFFASDESSWVTGQALAVDGGMTSQLQDDLAMRLARLIKERPEILDEIGPPRR